MTNCVLRTNCSNFKFGTESSGDLKDIAVAFLPVNLPYTMTPEMVAAAARVIRPASAGMVVP